MKRIFVAAIAAASLLLLNGATCKPAPIAPSSVDGGAVDAGPGSCAAACASLARFPRECAHELDPTDAGLSCAQVCALTPGYVGLPVACVSSATSLDELRRCNVCAP